MGRNCTLLQVEVRGIQDFIFGSNNLQQNTGASEIVKQATTEWVLDALHGWRHNAHWNTAEDRLEFDGQRLSAARGEAEVEVIYAGGGNALLLFPGDPDGPAREFTRRISRKVLQEARDLRLQVETLPVDWDSSASSLADQHIELRRQAANRRLATAVNTPLNGLSVTAACAFTGLPVVARDPDGRLIARTVAQKLARSRPEHLDRYGSGQGLTNSQRLHAILPDVRKYFYEFTNNFDQFGERGESSYIAVVHIDGNNMGKRFQAVAEANRGDNAAYIEELYRLSRAVQERSTTALRAVTAALIGSEKDGKFGGVVPVHSEPGQSYLPFRPIVFGGDDATFVCEGRLGLALAEIYLKALASEPLPGPRAGELGEPLYARAGVAMVKTHFPFSRSYELAGQLCHTAKQALEDRVPDGKGCIIDWHFSTTGVISSLSTLRDQEYTIHSGQSLLMRPIWVPFEKERSPWHWRTWDNFEAIVSAFQTDPIWADHRNKIMALREALRGGSEAVQMFLQSYNQPKLPAINGKPLMSQEGWQEGACGYFDAIEALDFFVPLSEPILAGGAE